MNPFLWRWDGVTGSAVGGQVCTDGIYVYLETRDSSMNHYLAKWDAATGTRLYYGVFTQAAGNNWSGPLMTDGTYLVTTAADGVHVFRCSDMSYVGLVYSSTDLYPNGFLGALGHFDGTYFWFGGLDWGGGRRVSFNRLTPGTWALSQLTSVSLPSSSHTNAVLPCMTDLILYGAGFTGIKRCRKDGTTVWTQGGFPGGLNGAVCDPLTGFIFITTNSCEVVVLQASDGQFVNRDGTVGGDFAGSIINENFAVGFGVGLAGGSVLISGQQSNPGGLQRRSTALPWLSGGYWASVSSYPGIPRSAWNWCVVGTRLFGAMGQTQGWSTAGLLYTDFDKSDPPAPKLTNVTPRTGKGLGLVFDAAVGMTGPTIGAPVDGIAVPAVTQSDSTHIDIDIDIPPTHPIGAAEDPTVPTPTGEGAYQL